ncbi:uncharacterized protein K444DRAFT_636652 [Hyaloscypha bicolor E]|uniref:Uncharacterized protein n=1 Tax=Hyaloscypha bicolor E TaxID=1095630 RepID=A0A2J6SKN5_9HELO|nr:uncharacterized protein K444DRAFT_636652 [Hyaloscypha bicolor E]PMD51338.1 hypothetical protein K444DRAFT_636652 [Hyaloscypha bicolor E]
MSFIKRKSAGGYSICFRLWPAGPYTFRGYQYTAIIKTDPDEPTLSGDRIGEIINRMGYIWDWDIDEINCNILSPKWTAVTGILFDPTIGIFPNTNSISNLRR